MVDLNLSVAVRSNVGMEAGGSCVVFFSELFGRKQHGAKYRNSDRRGK